MRRTRITVRIESYGEVGTAVISESAERSFDGNPSDVPNLTGHTLDLVTSAKGRIRQAMDDYVQRHGSFGVPLTINDVVIKATE